MTCTSSFVPISPFASLAALTETPVYGQRANGAIIERRNGTKKAKGHKTGPMLALQWRPKRYGLLLKYAQNCHGSNN